MSHTLGILGLGHLGQALALGLAPSYSPKQLLAFDQHPEKCASIQNKLTITQNAPSLMEQSDVLFLAIRPQQIKVLKPLGAHLRPHTLILSPIAGLTITQLTKTFPHCTIIRCMPNLAASVQMSITGLYSPPSLSAHNKNLATAICTHFGTTFWLPEEQMLETITALCGSGPGLIYALLELWEQAAEQWGRQQGLPPDLAKQAAQKTLQGALTLAHKQGFPIQTLVQQVAVPQGTTEAGINALKAHGADLILTAFTQTKARCNTLKTSLAKDSN
jgi:pyrroline-5-carboxylate reductase